MTPDPIKDMADQLKIPLHHWSDTALVYDAAGAKMADADAKSSHESFWSILEDAFKYSVEHSADIDAKTSLYDYANTRCQQDVEKCLMNKDTQTNVLEVSWVWGSSTGDSIEQQSLKFFFLEEDMEGGEKDWQFIATSFRPIMNEIANIPLAKAEVHMSTVMKSVKSTTEGVNVVISNGTERSFDDVVFTMSIWMVEAKSRLDQPNV